MRWWPVATHKSVTLFCFRVALLHFLPLSFRFNPPRPLTFSLSHSLSLPPVELSQSHTHTHRRFCAWFFHLTFISPHPALLFLHFFQPFAYCLLRLSSSSIVAITVKSASRSVSKSDWLISHSFNCPLVDARWVCVHYQWTDYYYYFYYYFPESC